MRSFSHVINLILVVAATGHGQPSNYVFTFLTPNPDRETLSIEEEQQLQESHLENSDKLFKEGKILASGPFEGGGGLFVLKANTLGEAETILATDPAIKANRWKLEMFLFQLLEGGICTAMEPYDMVTYSFVRFEESNAVANFKANEGFDNANGPMDFITRVKPIGKLLLAGTFNNNEGGILIYSGNSQEKLLRHDPAVTSGYLSIHTRLLFIAKGSFCEE